MERINTSSHNAEAASSSSTPSSSSSHNPQSRSFNRFSVLDQLEQDNRSSSNSLTENRSNSPTGSTDSSETVTPWRFDKRRVSELLRNTRNNK